MKTTTLKNISMLGMVGLLTALVSNANATLSWSSPLTTNSPNIVGTAMGATGNGQGSWTYEAAVAQALLDLGPNQTATPVIGSDVTTLATFSTDYNAVVITSSISQGGAGDQVGSGWDYVIAKYDGKNAGYILFYLGGEAANLPQFPANFWTTNPEQYAISGWTAFNSTVVPEPSTVVAGALLLIPLGVQAFRRLRK
jgi:hypothetical protein